VQYRKEVDMCELGEVCLYTVDEELSIEVLSMPCVYIFL